MLNVHLLIIDPQNDFCDPDRGALFVPGADADMGRLATLVSALSGSISDVHVTLDSHHPVDIAHPCFWKNSAGQNPAPFTVITVADMVKSTWTTTLPMARDRALAYLRALESSGRYPHVVWPEHCLIGSHGHNVVPTLFRALCAWERDRFGVVDYVTKGSNLWTEHFSAVQAEVPDPMDPDTQINVRLIQTLEEADLVLLAGEAGSHCLANTARDIAAQFADPDCTRKLCLLTDCTSPVAGFEGLQDAFIHDLKAKGMQTATSRDIISRFI